ncbi:MAG: type II toxin-antitoxin system Phd/YefM family antitoxin [Gammaproteobacteria bacterium]
MNQSSHFLPVTEAKNRLLHLIREIDEKDEVLTITRGGVPVAVLLSPNHYAGLLETIEVLADRQAMRSLRRSIAEGQAERWVTDGDEVFGKDPA